MNQKDYWSIVRYLGESNIDDLGMGLTRGQCYYIPATKDNPKYHGLIDDEEFTTYEYKFENNELEIVLDPTGVAKEAIVNDGCTEIICAHEFSDNNGLSLKKDSICGCFYCLEIFHPREIKEWVDLDVECDKQGTAICPYCGVDSIISESSGFPINREFLEKMRKYWFE